MDEKLTKTAVVKSVVSFVVGSGVYLIVTSIIKDHVAPETLPQKVKVALGTTILAGMVADAAGKYTDRMIDGVVAQYNEVVGKKAKEAQES